MDEVTIWELIKSLFSWVIYPLLLALAWFHREQTKDTKREIKEMRDEISNIKTELAVTAAQVGNIREDIRDLIKVVRAAEDHITNYLIKKE